MSRQNIYLWGLIPVIFASTFIFMGKLIYYIDVAYHLNFQNIIRYGTDYIDIAGLFLVLLWTMHSFYKDIFTIKLKLKWIGVLNVSAIAVTTLMYLLHDIYNFNTMNNDLCDAGWNFVTFLWLFCIAVNYGYVRILTYKLNGHENI